MQAMLLSVIAATIVVAASSDPNSIGDSLLGGLVRWYAGDDQQAGLPQPLEDFDEKNQQLYRVAKEFSGRFQPRMDDILLARGPSIRDQEYLEHSSLFGHQYVQGGAGEGIQHLKPDGSVKNIQVIKTDAALPAYCNPPNPCPPGYTGDDGCLEEFENTAAFSREYQGGQECMCDTEHMFDCPGADNEAELDTLARTLQNRELNESDLDQFVATMTGGEHKVVAKKFFSKKNHDSYLDKLKAKARATASRLNRLSNNPYLANGEKLRVIAKKAPHTSGVY